jgi:iron(III) transport system permease protein
LFGRGVAATAGRAAHGYAAERLTGWRAVAAAAPFLLVAGLALAPHAGVLLTSVSVPGSWYRTVLPAGFTAGNYVEALSHDMTMAGIRNSLGYAAAAVAVSVVLGFMIAWVVVRSTIAVRGLLDALAMIPLVVPGMVMAFGYLSVSSMLSNLEWVKESRLWQSLFDVRANPAFFLVIAYAVRRLPFMVRAAVAGLQQTSVTLEEAAANVGASPLTVARRIAFPLISANLIAGGLLVFAFSMLEVSDSLVLAQRADCYPITKTIYELFNLLGTGRFIAAALGVWAMVFLAVTILCSSLVFGKKMGMLFRV